MLSPPSFCPGEEASPEGRHLKTQRHGQTPADTAWGKPPGVAQRPHWASPKAPRRLGQRDTRLGSDEASPSRWLRSLSEGLAWRRLSPEGTASH